MEVLRLQLAVLHVFCYDSIHSTYAPSDVCDVIVGFVLWPDGHAGSHTSSHRILHFQGVSDINSRYI